MARKTMAEGASRGVSERIAIVGASVRAAAASAVRAGFSVAAADLFADEDLREIADATRIRDYPDGLADWLKFAVAAAGRLALHGRT